VVLRTLSQARAWRPAVVARLARTLGITKFSTQCCHGECAFQRTRDCRNADTLRTGYQLTKRRARLSGVESRRFEAQFASNHRRQREDNPTIIYSARRRDEGVQESVCMLSRASAQTRMPQENAAFAVCFARRMAPCKAIKVSAADAGYRDCSCRMASRQPESCPCKFRCGHGLRAVMPNTSLKRSANGRPPGPGRWYAVHFHQPGPGVLPLSPA
jgi:hypothetical protein